MNVIKVKAKDAGIRGGSRTSADFEDGAPFAAKVNGLLLQSSPY